MSQCEVPIKVGPTCKIFHCDYNGPTITMSPVASVVYFMTGVRATLKRHMHCPATWHRGSLQQYQSFHSDRNKQHHYHSFISPQQSKKGALTSHLEIKSVPSDATSTSSSCRRVLWRWPLPSGSVWFARLYSLNMFISFVCLISAVIKLLKRLKTNVLPCNITGISNTLYVKQHSLLCLVLAFN